MAKKEITKTFRYSFVCEHCDNDSGWKEVNVTGKNEEEIINKKLPEYKTGIERENYVSYLPLGAGKCKNCNQRQSWELGSISSILKSSLYIGVIVGSIGSMILMYAMLFGLVWAVVGFAGGFVLGFLLGFIIGIVNYNKIKENIKKTNKKHKPEVDWELH